LKQGYGVVYLHGICLLSILSGRLWAEYRIRQGKLKKESLIERKRNGGEDHSCQNASTKCELEIF